MSKELEHRQFIADALPLMKRCQSMQLLTWTAWQFECVDSAPEYRYSSYSSYSRCRFEGFCWFKMGEKLSLSLSISLLLEIIQVYISYKCKNAESEETVKLCQCSHPMSRPDGVRDEHFPVQWVHLDHLVSPQPWGIAWGRKNRVWNDKNRGKRAHLRWFHRFLFYLFLIFRLNLVDCWIISCPWLEFINY